MNEQKTPIVLRAIYSYVASVILALIVSPLFKNFYEQVFNPPKSSGMLSFGDYNTELLLGGFIFSYSLLLPLVILILVHKKQWAVWLIGIILPLILILMSGSKHLLWFIIFTVIGGIIGWLISLLMKKLKKA